MNKAVQYSAANAPAPVDALNALQPVLQRSMFWRPAYLAKSAWLEHLPFAFWLTEAHRPRVFVELGTHYGASYFAFCQAVERLALDTRCYAIDTWKGDEHAGFYGEEVHAAVRTHNDAHYSGFSRLVRSTFDEALDHFADGSIDLLHIDGLHTFEAVSHDFESWRGKLADDAVVIFHDTNVRERGFGVARLFEDLKAQYPTFEFVHGHGLGVVGLGKTQKAPLRRLFEADGHAASRQAIREVFARLGRGCADAFAAQRRDDNEKQLSADLAAARKQLAELKASAEGREAQADAQVKSLEAAVKRLEAEADERVRDLEALSRRLADNEAEAAEKLREAQDAAARAADRSEALQAEVGQFQARLAETNRELAAARTRGEAAKARESEVAQLRANVAERFDEIATLTRLLAEKEAQAETAGARAAALAEKLARLEASRTWRATLALRRAASPFGGRRRRHRRLRHLVQSSGFFDAEWYLAQNPDVAGAGADPLDHFLLFGGQEGRAPSPAFSSSGYLTANPDVRDAGLNPLVHYLAHGRIEGRAPAA
ncbi:class I SAM-dependent methyltransferase [Chelatococcus sp. XZ-Ab1]|uniref:class I SAM-dependent methyltransferase n=1 Tax=Chelatococcus sp. XZ-Ab1 TaxID=3034027 RepID=UPI0023E37AF3|nr:class I SAM-dependent methyltransferase [Chelatococcus sp. XZ-Ab1]